MIRERVSSSNRVRPKAFLMTRKVDRKLYYVEVDTPEGYWGTDIEGLYLLELLPWQTDLSLATCEGETCQWPTMVALQAAASGVNDNLIIRVRCGECGHEWMDGLRYQDTTVVRCPKCKTYNHRYRRWTESVPQDRHPIVRGDHLYFKHYAASKHR